MYAGENNKATTTSTIQENMNRNSSKFPYDDSMNRSACADHICASEQMTNEAATFASGMRAMQELAA